MTFWHLLVLAVLCAVLTAASFYVLFGDFTDNGALELAMIGVGTLTLVGSCFFGGWFIFSNLDRATCIEHGERSGVSTHYELLSGCYIKVDNKLVPYDRWAQVSGVNAP